MHVVYTYKHTLYLFNVMNTHMIVYVYEVYEKG